MSIDYNELFKQEAFRNIEPEKIEMFKCFIQKVEGKGFNEIFMEFMAFYKQMPKGRELSDKEKEALINTIYAVLPNSEKEKFNSIIKLMKNL